MTAHIIGGMRTYQPRLARLACLFLLWVAGLSLCAAALAENGDSVGLSDADRVGSLNNAADSTVQSVSADVRHTIDFDYLWSVAPNSVGWIYQPDIAVNQPIMYCDDPTYYLRRQFDDRISSNGAIFTRGEAAPDFSDSLMVLYGRNCLDETLFGSLSKYRDDAYYQRNPSFYLITPKGDYRLDVFAGMRLSMDDNAWRLEPEIPLYDQLPRILEQSYIQPLPSLLPKEDDDWVVLSTDSLDKDVKRYVLYTRKRPIVYSTDQVVYLNEMEMDSRETLNGRIDVPNVGERMQYAQNDPLWKKLVFEGQTSRRGRSFGDGGCGPTAVAMAVANLVDKEELPKIGAYASSPFGYRFCTCSVNDYWCYAKHLTYQITTPDEYLRYLPLAIASFATGNNIWGVQGRNDRFGSSMRYLEYICQVYDLSLKQTYEPEEALDFLRGEDTIAIACSSGYGSPFTNTSHFMLLAGLDEEYLYILDPLRRDDYEHWDVRGYLEVVTPGLVRVRFDDIVRCNLRPFYLMKRNTEP